MTWRKAVKAAELPECTGFHALRHYYASLLIARGDDEALGTLAASSRPAERSRVLLTCADAPDYQYPT